MNRVINGSIPEEIVFIYGGKRKIGNWWSDFESKKFPMEEVTPAFISDSKNQKTIESGENWAKGGYYLKPAVNVKKEIMKNDPVEGFKIIDLEKRSEGGRAYKILTPNGFYVDLREDVLLDTMLECGIEKGGILKGSFVWARVGSQMKLVRVGSELHSILIEKTEDKKLSNIPNTELEIGGIYKGKGNKSFVYFGRVDSTILTCKTDGRSSWSWRNNVTITKKELKNAMLWYEPYNFSPNKDLEKDLEEVLRIGPTYKFKVKTSHSVIKKIGNLKMSIPENIAEKIRSIGLSSIKEYNSRYTTSDEVYKIQNLCGISSTILMRKIGETIDIPQEYKDLIEKVR